jgi:hypothetical protein
MVTAELARALLSEHGVVRPQPHNDWSGSFPIPQAVERFYLDVGPANITIANHGNPFFLPSLADLWNFQAGYRWNGSSGDPIANWLDDWLVLADEGGDPFIVERSSGVVLHTYHGEGKWDTVAIFPDLNSMAACLAELGAIVRRAGDAFLDLDYSIRSEFRQSALARLTDLLGSTSDARAVLDSLGWG